MLAYLKLHWRGQQGIAQSLLINGVLAYGVLLAVTMILAFLLNPSMNALMIALLPTLVAWLGWFAVGTARSAIRTLRGGSSIAGKILAVLALVLLAAMLVLLWTDAQFVARWIRGLAAA